MLFYKEVLKDIPAAKGLQKAYKKYGLRGGDCLVIYETNVKSITAEQAVSLFQTALRERRC